MKFRRSIHWSLLGILVIVAAVVAVMNMAYQSGALRQCSLIRKWSAMSPARLAARQCFAITSLSANGLRHHEDQVGHAGCVPCAFLAHMSFLRDLKQLMKRDVEALVLCDVRNEIASNTCVTLDDGADARFTTVVRYLAAANVAVSPGKAQVANEGMLRIRLRNAPPGVFQGCYLVIEYVGFDETYIDQIVTDPACVRVQQRKAGSVAVTRLSGVFSSVPRHK